MELYTEQECRDLIKEHFIRDGEATGSLSVLVSKKTKTKLELKKSLCTHLETDTLTSELIYLFYHNASSGKCSYCGKPTKY